MRGLIPFFAPVLTLTHPEYEIISAKVEERDDRTGLSYTIRINRPIEDIYGRSGKSAKGKRGILIGTMYIYPTLIYSLLLSWPNFNLKRKIKLILIAFPLIVLLEMIDVPFYIIYHLEKNYISPPGMSHLYVTWVNILNSGGRQFLSLLLFFSLITPYSLHLPTSLSSTASPIKRNDHCPCGSGRKYKNCCMK